jgi:hypothetical protein
VLVVNPALSMAERRFRRAGVLKPDESFLDARLGHLLSLKVDMRAESVGPGRWRLGKGPTGLLSYSATALCLFAQSRPYWFDLPFVVVARAQPDQVLECVALHPKRSSEGLPGTFLRWRAVEAGANDALATGIEARHAVLRDQLPEETRSEIARWERELQDLP